MISDRAPKCTLNTRTPVFVHPDWELCNAETCAPSVCCLCRGVRTQLLCHWQRDKRWSLGCYRCFGVDPRASGQTRPVENFQMDYGGTGRGSPQSGRRKRKGRNDDELSGEEGGVSARGATEEQDDDSDGMFHPISAYPTRTRMPYSVLHLVCSLIIDKYRWIQVPRFRCITQSK